jgi:hypothetical protein
MKNGLIRLDNAIFNFKIRVFFNKENLNGSYFLLKKSDFIIFKQIENDIIRSYFLSSHISLFKLLLGYFLISKFIMNPFFS